MADTQKAKETLAALVEIFQAGQLTKTAALAVIPADQSAPSAHWSLANRMLQALAGTGDARGMKQWNEAGRSVKAGSKAFLILGPSFVKDKADPTGETKKLVGFHCIPVFRVEDTHGDPLPSHEPAQPPVLLGVAKAWGLNVSWAPCTSSVLGAYCQDAETITLYSHEQEVFLHELSHAAHFRALACKSRDLDKDRKEIVAQMAAAVLARVYGVAMHEDFSQDYVRSYAQGKDLGRVLMGLLSDVQKTVDIIITTANALEASEPATQGQEATAAA